MKVRAKFRVSRVESSIGSLRTGYNSDGTPIWVNAELRTIVLYPVYANSDPQHENNKFWQDTPNGEIRLGVLNPDAASFFQLGSEYYIDFIATEYP